MKRQRLRSDMATVVGRALAVQRSASQRPTLSEWDRDALRELSACVAGLETMQEELHTRNLELVRARDQLERERHRYRELFWAAPFGSLVTDLGGVVMEANRVTGRLLGVPPRRLEGRALPLYVDQVDRERFRRYLERVAASSRAEGQGRPMSEATDDRIDVGLLDRSRSRVFPALVVGAPLLGLVGEVPAIRWIIVDQTCRRQAEQAERLRTEARRKDEFLAVLGHELRNPLAAVTLASDLLAGDSPVPEDRRRWAAGVIKRHAGQLRRLVDDLLDVARVSRGKITLASAPIDLRDVVAGAAETVQLEIENRRQALAVVRPHLPVWVDGDAGRLRQVVSNLLANATKYTPAGGHISLELRYTSSTAVVIVADDGVGIAQDMLDRIFGLFEQIEVPRDVSERCQGLGLGLALVRQLVAMHGGTVRAHSEGIGRGSTFRVELPLSKPDGQAGKRSPDRDDGLENRPIRVLLVDDNRDARELLGESLRRRGYQVEEAGTGARALECAGRSSCAIGLIDIGLPDMDGFELCRRLLRRRPEMHLMAVTGYGDEETREQARVAGFAELLLKPVAPSDVVQAIGRVGEAAGD